MRPYGWREGRWMREKKSPEGDGCELSCDVCYWMACWREGDRTRNVHLGSAGKMDAEAARRKAREMKAEALGMQA
jgi:hypothetical protein